MISDLRLQNFRSYENESFEFESGVNIVVGPNASGKTNLLEAILVLCLGGSYRAKDAELVMHQKPWARIDGHVDDRGRTIKFEPNAANGKIQKNFTVDNNDYKRLSLQKTIPVVLFEPEDLRLLTGSPERRRDFLDDIIEQMVPGYATLRRQYRRTLTQRNALLKHGAGSNGQLFAWNIRLSELGGKVAEQRMELINNINKSLQTIYQEISSSKIKVSAEYVTNCIPGQYGSGMLKKLEANTELDFARGFTSYGPHRDDMAVKLNGHPASEVGSRGEIRTLLLGLKIVELRLVEEVRNQRPLLLLDDVFSELDGKRRMALTEFLSGYQTFITTTDADIVVQHFLDNCHIIPTAS